MRKGKSRSTKKPDRRSSTSRAKKAAHCKPARAPVASAGMKLANATGVRPDQSIDERLKEAVADFVIRVMEKPLTPRRLAGYYKKWTKTEGGAFAAQLRMRIRLLLAIQASGSRR